jgi:hypothetical protein
MWDNFIFHTVEYVMSKTHIIIMCGIIAHCTLCYVWNTYYHHVWDSFIFHTVHYVMSKTHIIIKNGIISHFALYVMLCRKDMLSSIISHCMRLKHISYFMFQFHTEHYVMSKTHIIIMYRIISHFRLFTMFCRKHIL